MTPTPHGLPDARDRRAPSARAGARGLTGFSALIVLALLVSRPAAAQEAPWPGTEWPKSTPAAQGMNGALFDSLDQAILNRRYAHVDRMVVVRNGYLVYSTEYDRDYESISHGVRSPLGCGIEACRDASEVHDYNYLHPSRHPWYEGRDVHTLQSVTKSVAATVLGAAIHEGLIPSVEAPLLSYFQDYDLTDVDSRLNEVTLHDLLTMRSGIEWHEQDRPLDETNTTLQLERSDDWIQFTLDQPMDASPGSRWVYNSGGSHLMSGIVRSATGRYIDEYAEASLFGPLGISEYHWKATPRGYPDTEGGLFMEAEDLARIGLLYLRDGIWDGTRLLPEGWVAQATARQVERVNPAGWGYGYQWWRVDRGDTQVWAGLGFGGQFLLILPEHDIVGVINSWNVFGANSSNVLMPFLDALIESVER